MTKIATATTSLSFPFNLINSGISFQPFAALPELIEITRIFRHLQLHKQVIYAAASIKGRRAFNRFLDQGIALLLIYFFKVKNAGYPPKNCTFWKIVKKFIQLQHMKIMFSEG